MAPPLKSCSLKGITTVALGVLLLAAAGLKVHGLAAAPINLSGMFATATFQVFLVEFEVFLGLWLLSGRQRIGAWLTALLAFAAFAGVSLYQGWIGRASCGCFGKLVVSPWLAFGIDGAAVAALLLGRPDLKPLWNKPRAVLGRLAAVMGSGVACMAVLGLLLLGVAQFGFGSVSETLAALRGERISVEPALVDVGRGGPGEQREAVLQLVNHSERPVRVIGGTSDCSCVVKRICP